MPVWEDDAQRSEDLERLTRWSGLQATAELVEAAAQDHPELRDEIAEGWTPVRDLRDAVAQLLIGQDWPGPDELAPIAAAAEARGLGFSPVRERVALEPDEVAEIQRFIGRYDLVLSLEGILETFRRDPDLYAEFDDCGRSLLDTMLRESFLDAVCQRFVGRSWPLYGDTPETAQAFYEALEAAVVPGVFELDMSASALVRRAAQRRERGDLAGALAGLEQALEAEPGHRGARAEQVQVQQALGQHEAALSLMEQLAREDDTVGLARLRGLSLAALGRAAEAIVDLERYVSYMEPPPDPDGRVIRRRGGRPGDLDEAKETLARLRA